MRRGHAPWPGSAPVPAHASPDSGGTSRPSPATGWSRCGVGLGMGHSRILEPRLRTEKREVSPTQDPWLLGEMPQQDALSCEESWDHKPGIRARLLVSLVPNSANGRHIPFFLRTLVAPQTRLKDIFTGFVTKAFVEPLCGWTLCVLGGGYIIETSLPP